MLTDRTHQPLHLGLFRSDYLLHQPTLDGPISLKQVEFNTIASSFGGLSQRVAGLHRCVVLPVPFGRHMNDFLFSYLLESTGYFGISPVLSSVNLPTNDTTSGLAKGMAEAHRAYDVSECVLLGFSKHCGIQPCNSAHILFVVEPHERNIFDQRLLEYQLFESCVPIFVALSVNVNRTIATASA